MQMTRHDRLQEDIQQHEYAVDLLRMALRRADNDDLREEIEDQIDKVQGELQVLINMQDDRL